MNFEKCTYISWDKYNESPEIMVQLGDILLVKTGSSYGKCSFVAELPKEATINPQFVVLKHIQVDAQYLTLVLQSSYARQCYDDFVLGTAIPTFTQAVLGNMYIPLPSMAEQKRIVDKTKDWTEFVEQLELGNRNLHYTIKQTKSKILELAIHGKLVPQDPTDEPASELLKRINPKAEIACDNPQYGNLPSHWVLTNLKSVFNINPKNKADDIIESGFVSMSNINEGFSNKFAFEVKRWGEIKSGFTHFSNGDIAVAKISPCLENRKSMVLKELPNGIGAGTTELHVFRPLCVDAQYGLYFFKSNKFIKQCVGTFNGVVGQQRVGKGVIEEMYFPLPPLNEQHRIVAQIEKLFAQLDNIASSL